MWPHRRGAIITMNFKEKQAALKRIIEEELFYREFYKQANTKESKKPSEDEENETDTK